MKLDRLIRFGRYMEHEDYFRPANLTMRPIVLNGMIEESSVWAFKRLLAFFCEGNKEIYPVDGGLFP